VVLSPSLLTCFHHFVQVRWPNLKKDSVLRGRMLRHELYCMIQVPRFKDENAAELFLGFRIGAIRSCGVLSRAARVSADSFLSLFQVAESNRS
jgi:hypothetical protein